MESDNFLNLTTQELGNEDLINLINQVYNDNTESISKSETEETILDFAQIELASFPTEVSISCGMTRQKVQYCPNVYHASMKLDVSKAIDFIINCVKTAPVGEKINTYVKLKRYHYKSLLSKINKHEDILRRALIERARADGAALPDDN